MKRVIMTGNEAVARGAYEAGCTVAAAYPGTPSTEILENVPQYKDDINCRWASNEKVALEIGIGAAIGGARALVTMKHVGMNVAADPLFTIGYAGVNGGLVVVSADDPGCHSSQNEQDNRWYAPHAKLALIEPSDSQECKEYMIAAFDISEKFDVPVLFRMTTRTCHSKSLVEFGDRKENTTKQYVTDRGKYALLPSVARKRHIIREELLVELEEYACTSPLNRVEYNDDKKIGIIASGISYQYAREVFGDSASYLKLGLSFPMPSKLIQEFADSVDTLYIIEENTLFIENKVRAMGIDCVGRGGLPICGELSTKIIRETLMDNTKIDTYEVDVEAPARPPVLCAGCPHRGYFFTLHKHRKDLVAVGDIGCYALGVNPPFNGFDMSICMGGGISVPIGLVEAFKLQGDKRKVFGMVGDSTFYHSGMTGLVDVVHNNINMCVCVLDNSITAMTGHQQNPGTEIGLMGEPLKRIEMLDIIKATGISEDRMRIVDPNDIKAMDDAVKAALATDGAFVIVTQSPCILIKEVARANAKKYCEVDQDNCKKCKACLKIACPALSNRDGVVEIDAAQCTACGLCVQLCKFDAIKKVGV